jgi:hypothetical protein
MQLRNSADGTCSAGSTKKALIELAKRQAINV